MSFLAQSSDCLIARDVRKRVRARRAERLVLVTDTLFDVNGVAATIKRMMREARRRGLDFTVVTCLGKDELAMATADPEILGFVDSGRLKIFTSVAELAFPEYDLLKIRFPPFLELLRYLQEAGFTKMQISTPGIIGLSGLLAAKTLQMQTAATYHTSIPEYVENYTRDLSLEALAWKYMIAFYHAVDEVLVPSKFIAQAAPQARPPQSQAAHSRPLGGRREVPPSPRTPGFWKRFGLENADELVKFVYVGRIGVEKNLELAAHAYRKLRATDRDAHLVIVGDGPYREELQRAARRPAGDVHRLPGSRRSVQGLRLGRREALPEHHRHLGQRSARGAGVGLPVIVSGVGGPAELMVGGTYRVAGRGRDVDELYDAMRATDGRRAPRAPRPEARAFAEANRIDEPFTAISIPTATGAGCRTMHVRTLGSDIYRALAAVRSRRSRREEARWTKPTRVWRRDLGESVTGHGSPPPSKASIPRFAATPRWSCGVARSCPHTSTGPTSSSPPTALRRTSFRAARLGSNVCRASSSAALRRRSL